MHSQVIRLIKHDKKTVVFLDSIILRYVTYYPESEVLNSGNQDGEVLTTKWVSRQRFGAFLKAEDKDQYWQKKIINNHQYKTQIRDFELEYYLNHSL